MTTSCTAKTKSQIIQDISKRLPDLNPQETQLACNTIIELMASTLINEGRIEIRGFGSFILRNYNARKAHNPRTGQIVATYPRKRAHFKPGKELRKRVNMKPKTQ